MTRWMQEGKHLPSPLRDFHDQKDVFKSLHEWIGKPVPGISWVDGHCYVIDYFLRFMAAHGWTMQRCRADVEFAELHKTIEDRREREAEIIRAMFAQRPASPPISKEDTPE